MNQNDKKRLTDISGVELTPGEPDACLGNGEKGFECSATSAIIIYIVFPNLIPKAKNKI